MLPKKILVPTDFGEAADAALDWAVELSAALGASVHLLHAFEIPTVGFPDATLGVTSELGRRIVDAARAGLDRLISDRLASGVPLDASIEQNEPWHAILDVARRENVDLIVMGTHGRRGLPRALLGSVADRVLRAATVPVLVVHAVRNKETDR